MSAWDWENLQGNEQNTGVELMVELGLDPHITTKDLYKKPLLFSGLLQ